MKKGNMDRRAFLRTAAATTGAALAADTVLRPPAPAATKFTGGPPVRAAVRAVDELVPRLMHETAVPGVAGGIVQSDDTARLHVEHAGQFPGAVDPGLLTPDTNLGVVILTNARPVGLAEAVAATFFDIAETGRASTDWFDRVYAPSYAGSLSSSVLEGKKRPTRPSPALADSAYVGTYTSNLYGPTVVASGPHGLTLSLGPKPLVYRLRHWSGNVFSYTPTGE